MPACGPGGSRDVRRYSPVWPQEARSFAPLSSVRGGHAGARSPRRYPCGSRRRTIPALLYRLGRRTDRSIRGGDRHRRQDRAQVAPQEQRQIPGPSPGTDKIERETRFYIASLLLLAGLLGPIIRSHWAIENSLHWVMDMVFRDDECRVRTDHAPANFTTIKHMAHNLVRKAPGKHSLRLKRKAAAWDDDFLASLIAA